MKILFLHNLKIHRLETDRQTIKGLCPKQCKGLGALRNLGDDVALHLQPLRIDRDRVPDPNNPFWVVLPEHLDPPIASQSLVESALYDQVAALIHIVEDRSVAGNNTILHLLHLELEMFVFHDLSFPSHTSERIDS